MAMQEYKCLIFVYSSQRVITQIVRLMMNLSPLLAIVAAFNRQPSFIGSFFYF